MTISTVYRKIRTIVCSQFASRFALSKPFTIEGVMQSIYSMAFGRSLKKIRIRSRLTQEKLAEIADLSRAYVSLLERGLRSPTFDTIMVICEALPITLEELSAIVSSELAALRNKSPSHR